MLDGKSARVTPKSVALLDCLLRNFGRVVPYEKLCSAIGCPSTDEAARRHLLRQYANGLNQLFARYGTAYVISVAANVGYGLSEIAVA